MYTVCHRQMSCATWLTLCTASTSVNHYLMLVFAGHCNFYSWQPSVSSLIQAVVLQTWQRCQAVALLKPVSNWNLRNNPQIILNQNRKIQSFWSFLGKKKYLKILSAKLQSCYSDLIYWKAYTVWETKFLKHVPENRCLLYVLYKVLFVQANFLLAQLKIYLHRQALVSLLYMSIQTRCLCCKILRMKHK